MPTLWDSYAAADWLLWLEEVAYMRFASVYRPFSSIEDFEKETTAGPTGSEASTL